MGRSSAPLVPPSGDDIDPIAPLDVFKVLGDNTRYAIYLELARSPRPLVTAEIAETLGLHPNTVRPHLERMREVGLVHVSTVPRGEIGRPQHRYSLTAGAPALGLEPPTAPLLARMVITMAERLHAQPGDAFDVGADEGRRRAAPYGSAPSALEAVVDDLDRLGFDPVVGDGDDDESVVVGFANCPFADLAAEHPQLVCSLHHGLIAGFVAGMGDAEVARFCPLTSATPCQVTLRSVG